jgi:hypothetical protein
MGRPPRKLAERLRLWAPAVCFWLLIVHYIPTSTGITCNEAESRPRVGQVERTNFHFPVHPPVRVCHVFIGRQIIALSERLTSGAPVETFSLMRVDYNISGGVNPERADLEHLVAWW